MTTTSGQPSSGPNTPAPESMVSKLLEIQKCRIDSTKSFDWVANLQCLEKTSTDGKELSLAPKPYLEDAYVAVSYVWDPYPSTDPTEAMRETHPRYTIVDGDTGATKSNETRNSVLDRAFAYAEQCDVPRVWIDRECVEQKPSLEKQLAMDSMDLVYSTASHPLGLLETHLEAQDDVNLLQKLLNGKLTVGRARDAYPDLSAAGEKCWRSAVQLLESLQKDTWWNRAWTFQEEYRSGVEMRLLIRHRFGLKKQRKFGEMRREMEIDPGELRDRSTRFLIALLDCMEEGTALQSTCESLLVTFGKYNVLHRFKKYARGRAMSSRIFADIGRRAITEPFDLLPIAANSCNYPIRLDIGRLKRKGHTLALSALAMYLLNGEVITDHSKIESSESEVELAEYIQAISFSRFEPPVVEKQLTWLKNCRLHNVKLLPQGMQTEGHLWKVTDKLSTKRWPTTSRGARPTIGALSRTQRSILSELARRLQSLDRRHHSSASRLSEYVGRVSRESSPRSEYMELMAATVADAIESQKPVFVAYTASAEIEGVQCGVFVGRLDVEDTIFTSWNHTDEKDGRSRTEHVSLKVGVVDDSEPPLLTALDWTNGLIFFSQASRATVLLSWPRAWLAPADGSDDGDVSASNEAAPERSHSKSRKRRIDLVE